MPFVQNKWRSLTISVRIAILFCTTFTIGLVLAFTVTYYQLSYSLKKTSKEVISAKLHETSAILLTGNIRGLREFFTEEKNRILNAPFMVRVLSPDGAILYMKPSVQEENFDFAGTFSTEIKPEKRLGWQEVPATNDEDMFDILTMKVGSDFYLQVGKSSEEREDVLEKILYGFLFAGVVLILLGGVLGVWYARRSLKPLRQMLETIQGIEKGDLGQRVPLQESEDELRELGVTFNRMIGRIENLIQVMGESLDNVAHDVRTPLTRLRVVIEEALLNDRPETHKEALEDCAEGVLDISAMVDQLMSISEAQAGTLFLQYENCKVEELIRDVLEIYDFVAQEKEIEIKTVLEPNIYWNLDFRKTKQILGNLLDNAIKFSPEKTCVTVHAQIEGDNLRLSVKDQGPGVKEEDLEKIWDRLYRGDKSRSTKGSGLGLAIVRAITQAHGGKVVNQLNNDRGMEFAVYFPKN